ncbi:hypothetical protein MTBBW1_2200033 [Desulfamplus magnetovallimortis]|uniref:Prepilin-type N-terminal cleavage/methylation domain-containing protein n=1 Tax=Desulfamplus magnetovallimortis TaxID=1246637 RepID=A0A1W1HD25_9BACT|nr:prepilin-type N-terminal cleavage/methylation domain-containing protein [Desulfamplus magnetovallimortis]SLM30379.1 hypothetical protein MTBBW1_2200033 [Desulfamplus magnetovallimortis]
MVMLMGAVFKKFFPNSILFKIHSGKSGFTLIEIMVVMILLAIASSLVLMNVGHSGRMKQSRLFAEKLVKLCKTARIEATNRSFPVCMTILPDDRECRVLSMNEITSGNGMNFASNGNSGEESREYRGDGSDMDNDAFPMLSDNHFASIPETVEIKGENIRSSDEGIYYICFYPDGSSSGGLVTVVVEDQFEFTFQVDMLTGIIRTVEAD